MKLSEEIGTWPFTGKDCEFDYRWYGAKVSRLEDDLKHTNDLLQEAIHAYRDLETKLDAALLQLSECQDSYRAMCEQVDAAKAQNQEYMEAISLLKKWMGITNVSRGGPIWGEIVKKYPCLGESHD